MVVVWSTELSFKSDRRGERCGQGVPQAWNDGVGPWEAGDGRMERRGWTNGAGMGSALVGKDECGRFGGVLERGDVWRGAQTWWERCRARRASGS